MITVRGLDGNMYDVEEKKILWTDPLDKDIVAVELDDGTVLETTVLDRYKVEMSRRFGKPYDEVTSEERHLMKVLMFHEAYK